MLDVDGTLLDSNDAHTQSWIETLSRFGFEASYAAVRPLIGKGGDKMLPELTGLTLQSDLAKQITEARTQAFQEQHLHRLQPTRGARELVQKIIAADLKPVVATSAGAELAALLAQAGVDDLIQLSTTSDDAAHSKPDGDIVRAALEKARVQAHEAVMVGDTPFDAQAANRAGVRSVALRCGGWWKDSDHGLSVEIYDDPLTLVEQWNTSIFSRSSYPVIAA